MISFSDFGGNGQVLHFTHANGYPAMTYKKLLTSWSKDFKVIGMTTRPMWEGARFRDARSWANLADDLIQFLEEQELKEVIGVGHSMGAIITLIASVKRPDLFKKLILIEPVILLSEYYRMMKFMPLFLRKRFAPPAKIARKRKDVWESKEAAFEYLRPKRVFSKIADDVFMDFIEHGMKDTNPSQSLSGSDQDGKRTLAFSKEWETHIYTTAPNPWKYLNAIQHPTLILKADKSNVITKETWGVLNDLPKIVTCQEIPNSTHLVPFELLEEVTEAVYSFVKT